MIVGEVFFAAYKKSYARFEGDALVREAAGKMFGGVIPCDMASVIQFMMTNNGLKDVQCL